MEQRDNVLRNTCGYCDIARNNAITRSCTWNLAHNLVKFGTVTTRKSRVLAITQEENGRDRAEMLRVFSLSHAPFHPGNCLATEK